MCVTMAFASAWSVSFFKARCMTLERLMVCSSPPISAMTPLDPRARRSKQAMWASDCLTQSMKSSDHSLKLEARLKELPVEQKTFGVAGYGVVASRPLRGCLKSAAGGCVPRP